MEPALALLGWMVILLLHMACVLFNELRESNVVCAKPAESIQDTSFTGVKKWQVLGNLQATPLVPGENGPWVPTQRQEQFVNHFWGGLGVPGFTAFSLSAFAGAHSHPAQPLARPDTPQTTARPPSSHPAARVPEVRAVRGRPPARSRHGARWRSRRCRRACVWRARSGSFGLPA